MLSEADNICKGEAFVVVLLVVTLIAIPVPPVITSLPALILVPTYRLLAKAPPPETVKVPPAVEEVASVVPVKLTAPETVKLDKVPTDVILG